MTNFKVLNLYACLGGNRLKWNNCQVTAVEKDPHLAELYQQRFPEDIVIIADAHQYLLEHYKEFDFIWSSPPCPSHSRCAYGSRKSDKAKHKPVFPDLVLYEEIIFLENYFLGKYCVENVIPYYEPLIPAQKRGRHLYWTNFILPKVLSERKSISMKAKNEVQKWCEFHEYDFKKYKGNQTVQKIARNLVDYEAGLTIFNTARGIFDKSKTKQLEVQFN